MSCSDFDCLTGKVWVQLLMHSTKDHLDERDGGKTEVDVAKNISRFAENVKKKFPNLLKHCDVAQLQVYTSKEHVWDKKTKPLDVTGSVPQGKTLYVKAPLPPQPPAGERPRCGRLAGMSLRARVRAWQSLT